MKKISTVRLAASGCIFNVEEDFVECTDSEKITLLVNGMNDSKILELLDSSSAYLFKIIVINKNYFLLWKEQEKYNSVNLIDHPYQMVLFRRNKTLCKINYLLTLFSFGDHDLLRHKNLSYMQANVLMVICVHHETGERRTGRNRVHCNWMYQRDIVNHYLLYTIQI